jgi:glycosyltransferase involved in cell wall biosynthesis
MIALANRWSSRVITVSAALGDEYVRRGLSPKRLAVVHNGIEVQRFHHSFDETRRRLHREFAIPGGAPIVATVSVLRPAKGIEVLIEAIEAVPDAVFLIIGDGPKREEWQQLATARGVGGRIRWAGFRTDVDALLAGCDLLAHPSLDEAFPTVLLEAMAAGLPVVATDVGGIPEIVQPGITGSLVPAGDAGLLADAIRRSLGDRVLLHRMREAALQRASVFSTTSWIARLTSLYREVLTERPAQRASMQTNAVQTEHKQA